MKNLFVIIIGIFFCICSHAKPKVIFVQGNYLHANLWKPWHEYYKSKGYTCEIPFWPGKEIHPLSNRSSDKQDAIGQLDLELLYDYYFHIVMAESEPPIMIGNDAGAVIIYKLLLAKKINTGIIINLITGASNKIPVSKKTLLSTQGGKVFILPYKTFLKWPAAGMDPLDARNIWMRGVMFESYKLIQDIYNFQPVTEKVEGRLLYMAGENDPVTPIGIHKKIFEIISKGNSKFRLKTYNRSHLPYIEKGWMILADDILDWIQATE